MESKSIEIFESLKIIEQAMNNMPKGPYKVQDKKITPPPRKRLDESMEALIHHFKIYTEGFKVQRAMHMLPLSHLEES